MSARRDAERAWESRCCFEGCSRPAETFGLADFLPGTRVYGWPLCAGHARYWGRTD